MRQHLLPTAASVAALFTFAGFLAAQTASTSGAPAAAAKRTAYYLSPSQLDLQMLLPPPPAQQSSVTQSELAELHRLQNERAPQEVAAAQADDKNEDIFVYAGLFGAKFDRASLPLLAALSDHLRNDVGVVDPPLKKAFGGRARLSRTPRFIRCARQSPKDRIRADMR